jgi:hypothetical protein
MPLPRGDEYLSAIQNPRTAFADADLKVCTAETDQFGIPKPYSGGFTTTFRLSNHSKEWATRCFTRAIPDIQLRYESFGKFLQRNPNSYFVNANCLPQGIRIGQQWHPIIKMEWLNGETLNSFIDRNISNPSQINNLIPEFLKMVNNLEQLGIAHGDLQHGNIVVKNNKLHLIDYDGIYLPELSQLKTNEIGHLNYQHPGRNEKYYNSSIDRFASIVIYLGLQAIYSSPALWRKYDNSENILFRADDFVNVETSQLLSEMSALPQLAQYVDRFRGICKLEFEKVPTLNQFIQGNFVYPKVIPRKATSSTPASIKRSQYLILDAAKTGSLNEHIGERIEVVGQISASRRGWARNRRPYVFINFGFYPNHTFTLVLWSINLATFQRSGINPQDYEGKWVKVSGVIGSYKGKPQMLIETPSQIQILSNEQEAKQWLGGQAPISTQASVASQKIQTGENVFNNLYAGRSATPIPNQQVPIRKVTIPSQLTSNNYVSKKKYDSSHGIIGSVILAIVGGYTLGVFGVFMGIIIGYQIGKRM